MNVLKPPCGEEKGLQHLDCSHHGNGANVTGVTDAVLATLMSQGHAAGCKTVGRSAYARLTVYGGIPRSDATIEPIFTWARACFEEWVPKEIMLHAWISSHTA